jgi:hypothetical protein
MTSVKFDLPFLSLEPDRHGNERLYVRRAGRRIRIKEKPGTQAFANAYAAALEALAQPAPTDGRPSPMTAPKGTLGWLAAKYYASDEFGSLDPQSQITRRRVIDSCLNEPHSDDDPDPLRNCPLQFVTSKKIKRLRDLKAKEGKPGAANNRKKYLSSMFGWAIEAEYMKSNPARDVRRKKYATNGFYTWTLSDLTAFENRHPIGSKGRLALSLLLYLGVRRGDPGSDQREKVMPKSEMLNSAAEIRHKWSVTMKNRLSDLNDHLFAQLERLSDEDLSPVQIDSETKRGAAIVAVADQIIRNASLKIQAAKILSDHGIDPTPQLPANEGKPHLRAIEGRKS